MCAFTKEKNLITASLDRIGFLLFPLTFMSLINKPDLKKKNTLQALEIGFSV